MIPALRLPFQFDPARLAADLALIAPDEWVPHFNTSIYEGDWSGVALRSVGGRPAQLYPDPAAEGQFADTALLGRCAYFQHVLATLRFPLEAARLLRLRARSSIAEHRDYKLGVQDGSLRIHVPVATNPDVAFFLDGQRVLMLPGESWYLNLNLPHRVDNQSDTDRVHLVIDGLVNPWVQALFPEGSEERTLTYQHGVL
jgi:hypothetical protein